MCEYAKYEAKCERRRPESVCLHYCHYLQPASALSALQWPVLYSFVACRQTFLHLSHIDHCLCNMLSQKCKDQCRVILWVVVVHTSMRCILDHGRGKVCEWGRGNGAYWIDGVEEAHRQMVPHQGNLNRHLPSSSSMGSQQLRYCQCLIGDPIKGDQHCTIRIMEKITICYL